MLPNRYIRIVRAASGEQGRYNRLPNLRRRDRMGVAVTLVLLGALFGVVAVIGDPGVFAVILAVACVTAGLAFGISARPRTGDR